MPSEDWSKAIQVEVIFYTGYASLPTIFLVSMVLILRGNQVAKYFLWVRAALMILALPLMNRANMISHIAAGLMSVFFLYVFYTIIRYGMEHVDVSHEETYRALVESNRRIDEERRTLARRLYDEVNPQLLFTCNASKQLESLVAGNGRAVGLLGNASGMPDDAYAEMRDIIKNTRIEAIDSVSLTAASELLAAHYTNTSGKPVITLEYDLSRRPATPEASTISAYRIIREVIFNVIKHSKAAQVRVSIHHNKALDTCKVEIADDGVGMKTTTCNGEHAGIRLINIRERVRVLGGALKIQAADPANQKRPGTKLSFSFSGQLS